MLGWHISIFRQESGGSVPATFASQRGVRIAVWQTGHSGLDWIDTLVKRGTVIGLGGNGYPKRYTAQKKAIDQQILGGPPQANSVWICGPADVTTAEWVGRTSVDNEALSACEPDEWLLIEAWDES